MRIAALLIAGSVVLAAVVDHSSAFAGSWLSSMLGSGGESGKLAKLQFRLRDSFYVTSLAWSPDGRYLASSSTEGNKLHIWDVQRRTVIKELSLGAANPNFHTLAWSPDTWYLAACGPDSLHVYQTRDWSLARSFSSTEAGGCVAVAFSSDSAEIALLGRRLRVFATAGWKPLRESDITALWGRGLLTNTMAYVPGGHSLLVGGGELQRASHEGVMRESFAGFLWLLEPDETVPGRKLRVFGTGPEGGADVVSVAVSPNGRRVATGTTTGEGSAGSGVVTNSVHIVSLPDGARLGAPLDGQHFGPPSGLAYTADGQYLIAGHRDEAGFVHLIEADSARVVDEMRTGDRVYAVAVNPQAAQFAASSGKQILIWSLVTGH